MTGTSDVPPPPTNTGQQVGSGKWAEYLRRNLIHAKAVGALANTETALRRLEMQADPPKWLIRDLEEIMRRLQDVQPEVARWRNIALDAHDGQGATEIRTKCPWPDFVGKEIFEGSVIRHPDGSVGTVLYDPGRLNQWRVRYEDGQDCALSLQIGDRGRAVVVR